MNEFLFMASHHHSNTITKERFWFLKKISKFYFKNFKIQMNIGFHYYTWEKHISSLQYAYNPNNVFVYHCFHSNHWIITISQILRKRIISNWFCSHLYMGLSITNIAVEKPHSKTINRNNKNLATFNHCFPSNSQNVAFSQN